MLWSQKVCQKYIFLQSEDPNFQTVKKYNLWEKMAVHKSAWIRAWVW